MKKKFLFIFIFLSVVLFKFLTVSSKSCYGYIDNINYSKSNIIDRFGKDNLSNIKKICTNNICTYDYDNNFDLLYSLHSNKVINRETNTEMQNIYKVKGVTISKIYFDSCIFIP